MADLLHLVDKPEGWTSHDVVARLRGILGERRIGHAGTLDPFASGLLVLGEGRTTPLLSCIGLLPKRYVARALLGVETDTQDRTGRVVASANPESIPGRDRVEEALAAFRGRIMQCPPAYSAVKVGGERSYRVARRGGDPERKPRPAHVYALELSGEARHPEIAFTATVSRGTYVRTLAHDLGRALGCGAHLTALRRTAIGPFQVEDALSPAREAGHAAERFRERAIPPERALSFLPRMRLDRSEADRLRFGAAPSSDPARLEAAQEDDPLPPGEAGWPVALLDDEGMLVALARPMESQRPGEPMVLLRVMSATPERTPAGEEGR
ncbi:MAG TPA: tRNA pseudouridine(55) synthase TruB [Candidatus Eisenbacteria bacterium]|nr:tRNA pseudouridine(55) synthase TruB [Candidatus Eisenbacteria bacterium]